MPPTTRTRIKRPRAATPSSATTAPAARGTPRRWIAATTGDTTVATTNPPSTGETITEVASSSRISENPSAATPSSSHEANPRSRSQRGAEKTADSSLSCAASRCTVCTGPAGGTAPAAGAVPIERRHGQEILMPTQAVFDQQPHPPPGWDGHPLRRSTAKRRNPPSQAGSGVCAGEDLNLHGPFRPQGPQPCASTNSATSAGGAGTHSTASALPRPGAAILVSDPDFAARAGSRARSRWR